MLRAEVEHLRDDIRAPIDTRKKLKRTKLRGVEDLPSGSTRRLRKGGSTDLEVVLGFSVRLDEERIRSIKRSVPFGKEGALVRAAVGTAEEALIKSREGVSTLACFRERDSDGCVWWCCEDANEHTGTCVLQYCEVR